MWHLTLPTRQLFWSNILTFIAYLIKIVSMQKVIKTTIITLTVNFLFIVGILNAQQPFKYQEPPKGILELVDAEPLPTLLISPTKEYLIFVKRPGYPDISELSEDELRLAGIRINPATFGPSRTSYATGIELKLLSSNEEIKIQGLPENLKVIDYSFSASGNKMALVNQKEDQLELWVLSLKSGELRRIDGDLNGSLGRSYTWLDNDHIIYKSRTNKSKIAVSQSSPEGPAIQESGGDAAPVRTYQDLLKSPDDEKLFDHYTQSVLIKANTISGVKEYLGIKGVISGLSTSPDGNLLMINDLRKPYSYIVPYYRFPEVTTIYDTKGKVVVVFNESPLTENIPKGFSAVPTGKRSINWRGDKPSTLTWVEALDKGDPAVEVEFRDQVFMQDISNGKVVEGPKTNLRYAGITWGDENRALLNEYWWASRQIITKLWDPSKPNQAPEVIFDRSREDQYNDPGNFVTMPNQYGNNVLYFSSDGLLFLTGNGASPEGNRPFIDEFNLKTKETIRLWRSEAPYYERPISLLDDNKAVWVTRRESVDEPPNYFKRNLKDGSLDPMTKFENPYVSLTGIGKEMVAYQRADGLNLSGTLFTPAGYDKEKDGPLPVFMWAYPREFKSADAASQLTRSPYEFTQLNWGSPLYWVTQGYAIFNDFSMPILGEGDEEPNETFVDQLQMSADAAINALVDMGVADRNRIAVGGHSYGAFMTANLLAHTNLFAAGIARSGAYNRTLTPFGFQSEQRTYWEAPEIYYNMSPFNYAHKIKSPILLIHGEADNNSGTFPMQSERFFAALKGHGVTSRLVMLPHESHGYRARQSVLHTLWEMDRWLDKHVKNKSVHP